MEDAIKLKEKQMEIKRREHAIKLEQFRMEIEDLNIEYEKKQTENNMIYEAKQNGIKVYHNMTPPNRRFKNDAANDYKTKIRAKKAEYVK